MPESERPLRIGDVAERTGLTQRTIRYYEELGLLSPTTRTHGDYRVFCEDDVDRLKKIRELRDVLGFSLAEIGKVLEAHQTLQRLKASYNGADHLSERLKRLDESLRLTEDQIALVDNKLAGLHSLRVELTMQADRYRNRLRELEESLSREDESESE